MRFFPYYCTIQLVLIFASFGIYFVVDFTGYRIQLVESANANHGWRDGYQINLHRFSGY